MEKLLNRTAAEDASKNLEGWTPELESALTRMLLSEVWEERLGGLIGAKVLVKGHSSDSFDSYLVEECQRLLEDSEVRVRLAVGECLYELATKHGIIIFEQCSPCVLKSIYDNFDRDNDEQALECSNPSTSPRSSDSGFLDSLLQASYKERRPGVGEMRHGTEGWKCLETSVKALQALLEGTGEAVRPYVTPELRDLLYRCLQHQNRFVRETGCFTMATLCHTLRGQELVDIAEEVAAKLADSLSDNWSQVRYAACVATRSFMESLDDNEVLPRVLPLLVGPMCLNRYYVAEGVRLYAQETWRRVMKDTGRRRVAEYVDQVVGYYIRQSKASNHAVREAACACIAELMEKIDPAAVTPHVPNLLRALVMCFKDMSWPVRDAACTACGRCVLAYPQATRPVLEELYDLWFAHLWDNIPTVRENSAVALSKAVQAYGQEALDRVLPVVREMLPKAHEQPNESKKYSDLENVTQFGVAARKARDNDPAVHQNQDMFSCGSLTARFSTSYLVKSDGCMDWGFTRGKEPWEASDGSVYLVRELATCAPTTVIEFLPGLADLARISTFQHAFNMHETLWRSLPVIARALGKGVFKPHLEQFLGPMFGDLTCGHQLAEAAAGKCIAEMRDLLGPRIFAGRLTQEQLELMSCNPNVASVVS